jgi:hypothetical protein
MAKKSNVKTAAPKQSPAVTQETIAIDLLKIDPSNAKKHGERSVAEIKKSLQRYGQVKPIVIDKNNVVRAGNGTLTAALQLLHEGDDRFKTMMVVRSDLSAAELTAYAISDNRTAEFADWDLEVLAEQLKMPGMGDVGFTDDELKQLDKDLGEMLADDKQAGEQEEENRQKAAAGNGPGLGTPIIHYDIIFDNDEQQQRWFKFIRKLKADYPDSETLAARLDRYIARPA